MNNEKISPEKIYKYFFYGILFIFLTIILLLLLKKSKKEKYDKLPIQIPTTSNIIQIDIPNGDLSELNTNSILNNLNNIVQNFINGNTFNNTNLIGTENSLNNCHLINVNFNKNVIFPGSINVNNIGNINLSNSSQINLSGESSIICDNHNKYDSTYETPLNYIKLFDTTNPDTTNPPTTNYLYLNNNGEIGYINTPFQYILSNIPNSPNISVSSDRNPEAMAGFKINGTLGYMSINTNLTNSIQFNSNKNFWCPYSYVQSDSSIPISDGYSNSGNSCRSFVWAIEQCDAIGTGTVGKSLGLCINITNDVGPSNWNSTNYDLVGYFNATLTSWDDLYNTFSFTGEHSSMVCNEEYNKIMNSNEDMIGLIVCSSGEIYNLPYNRNGDTYKNQIDNIKPIDSQPMSCLSNKYKDKRVLGVISSIENKSTREDTTSSGWTGVLAMDNDGRKRIRVASIGEGGMWITNEYGNLENGDYICSSNISGYGCLQNDDIKHSYTVAKILMNCDFNINQNTKYKTRKLGYFNNKLIVASYVAVTFHCG